MSKDAARAARAALGRSALGIMAAMGWAGCAPAVEAPQPRSGADFMIIQDRSSEASCASRDRSEELMCRADRRVMETRKLGDSASLRCHAQRGREMRAAYRQLDENRSALGASSADPSSEELAKARIRVAEQSMERTFAMLEDCERNDHRVRTEVRAIPVVDEPDVFRGQPF